MTSKGKTSFGQLQHRASIATRNVLPRTLCLQQHAATCCNVASVRSRRRRHARPLVRRQFPGKQLKRAECSWLLLWLPNPPPSPPMAWRVQAKAKVPVSSGLWRCVCSGFIATAGGSIIGAMPKRSSLSAAGFPAIQGHINYP